MQLINQSEAICHKLKHMKSLMMNTQTVANDGNQERIIHIRLDFQFMKYRENHSTIAHMIIQLKDMINGHIFQLNQIA